MNSEKETINRVNTLHEKAMDLAEEAFFAERKFKKDDPLVIAIYKESFEAEYQAAVLCPEDASFSQNILYRSAMHLAVNAGEVEKAAQIAEKLLSICDIEEFRQEATEVLSNSKKQNTCSPTFLKWCRKFYDWVRNRI